MPKEPEAVLKGYARQGNPIQLDQVAPPKSLRDPPRIAAGTIIVQEKKPASLPSRPAYENIGWDKIAVHETQPV
jgi:hypothetical protein